MSHTLDMLESRQMLQRSQQHIVRVSLHVVKSRCHFHSVLISYDISSAGLTRAPTTPPCPPTVYLSVTSGQFQDALHHRADAVKDLVDRSVAHEGAGGDQLVLLVHVALSDARAHMLAAQLVDGWCGVRRVRIPERKPGLTVRAVFCRSRSLEKSLLAATCEKRNSLKSCRSPASLHALVINYDFAQLGSLQMTRWVWPLPMLPQ